MEPIDQMKDIPSTVSGRQWSLAAKLLDFDCAGVVNFRSPYSIEILNNLLARLQTKIWSGDYLTDGDNSLQVFRALMPRWCAMTLYLLQLRLIEERSVVESLKPLVTPEAFPTLEAYLRGDMLPDHDIIGYLLSGANDPEIWRWPIRMFLWRNRIIKRCPKGLVSPTDTLVSAYSTSLDKWLKREQLRPVMWEPSWFFSPLDKMKLSTEEQQGRIESLIEFIDQEATAIGVPLGERDKIWLMRQFSVSAAAARAHLMNALKADISIPKNFLSAASGTMWDRLMRIAVKKNGGHVTGFEHGCGLGFQGNATPYYSDWFNCDRYVSRSRLSMRLIEEANHIYKDLPIAVPVIDPTDISGDDEKKANPISRLLNAGTPTVMFVPFGTSGERARGGVLPPDITAVDFNARCVGLLKEMGFNIFIKPHPVDQGPGIDAYKDKLKIEGTNALFEDVLDQADLVITCDPRSTTTIVTINAGIPIVILDIEIPVLAPALLRWIKERANVVRCHFNEDERIEMDMLAFRELLSGYLQS